MDTLWSWLFVPLEIVAIDVLLGADNAILIALACRALPRREVRSALIFGAVLAVLLRVVLTLAANLLLSLPYLRLGGALVLLAIAVGLVSGAEQPGRPLPVGTGDPEAETEPDPDAFLKALATIVAADALMSLDNVVALGTVAGDHLVLLAAGLMLSVPIIFFGSWVLSRLSNASFPLVLFGGVVLGWVAGGLAVSDPALSGWVSAQAPALTFVLPLLTTIFVLTEIQREPRRA